MIFHKKIESAYKSMLFARCDDTGLVKYFGPDDFIGLCAEEFVFKSSAGHDLKGYFYSYEGYDPSRLIIFDHGFGGGHRSYMKEIEKLCSCGYRVFSYDHTGCMESGGSGANGFSQSLHDLDDCLKALKSEKLGENTAISVIGHSWGGLSTLNILSLHPDIKSIVVFSGPISAVQMVNQNFQGLLKGYRKHIYALEAEANPDYVGFDAVTTLSNTDSKALLIYSDNDALVKKEFHYDVLYNSLKDKENIEFILESNKGHNPNYTESAVKYLAELGAKTKEASKLTDADKREEFKNSFDWDKMTEQDEAVWEKVFEFLK